MSYGDPKPSSSTNYFGMPPRPRVCPGCGRCNTCGHGPYYPPYPYPYYNPNQWWTSGTTAKVTNA